MDILKELDLSGTWKFITDTGEETALSVPGGGWLKQGLHCEAGTYFRQITIPDAGIPQVTLLELGAVNHYAAYYIGRSEDDLVKVYEDITAFTPQVVDLTAYVQPGETYLLKIFVRAYENGRPIAPHAANWCECIARGIFRYARMRVYPRVRIRDVFVRTYVSMDEWYFDLWVENASESDRTVTLTGELTSWNNTAWTYPAVPPASFHVKAASTEKATVGPIKWGLGEQSYWWPNIPYKENYRTELHVLGLTLADGEHVCHTSTVRFGFREIRQDGKYYTLNGTRVNFRGDSLQPANYDRIDWGGKGDALGTLPGFLPPSAHNPGWPKAVDNFQKLNLNVQRQHMMPWTPYMLDVCDEMGLMLMSESASRLNGFDRQEGRAPYEAKCLADIVKRDRNHPSIIRWSTVNEPQCADPQYHAELYEAVKAHDGTRPISEDIWIGYLFSDVGDIYDPEKQDVRKIFETLLVKDDFTWIEHYLSYGDQGQIIPTSSRMNDAVIPLEDRPFGLGEADWNANGNAAAFVNFAATTMLLRAAGASDVRPYVLLANWASSVPGVKTSDFVHEGDRFQPFYGEDNLPDPWNNRHIRFLRNGFSPYLAFDREFWHANRKSNGAGAFPMVLPKLKADCETVREITVFNDGLEGEELELSVYLKAGNASNRKIAEDRIVLRVKNGFSKKVSVRFTTPPLDCILILIIEVGRKGEIVFRDEETCYEVADGVMSEWSYAAGDDRSIDSLRLQV